MSKTGLILKIIAAVLIILILAYSGLWFFMAYQIKKELSENIATNLNYSSFFDSKDTPTKKNFIAENIAVSGFPLSQKTTVKNLRLVEKGKIITFKNIEIESDMFSSNFLVTLPEPIIIQNLTKNKIREIQLNPDHKINITAAKDKWLQINYKGSGYKILDDQQNVKFIVESTNSQTEITNNNTVNFKDSNDGYRILDDKNNIIFSAASSSFNIISSKENEKITTKININIKDFSYPLEQGSNTNLNKNNLVTNATINTVIHKKDKIVNLLSDEQMAKIPVEHRARFQKKPSSSYIGDIDIDLVFSNSLCKIALNGNAATSFDESMPFGLLTIKIENLDNLINSMSEKFRQLSNEKALTQTMQNPHTVNKKEMMLEFATQINSTLKTLAVKNSQSTENLAVFEIKRNKGASFLINDTSFFEIILQSSKNQSRNQNPSVNIPNQHQLIKTRGRY